MPKAKVEMTLPIECMIADTVTKKNYFVLGLISLVTGFCYYVFFRERSAYFLKTPLSSIKIPSVFCNFIPDFLWAVSFTAMLLSAKDCRAVGCTTRGVHPGRYDACKEGYTMCQHTGT